MSLIEKAEQAFDEKQAQELEKKLQKNKFDLDDMLSQFSQLKKMGSIESVLGGLGIKKKDMDKVDIDAKRIDRQEAILRAMTPGRAPKARTAERFAQKTHRGRKRHQSGRDQPPAQEL